MKFSKLPAKDLLTYFNVQLFHNNGGKGVAKNVVQVTYSTHPDRCRAKNDRALQKIVRFDLRSKNQEINRMIKKHQGEEVSSAVKATIRSLKKEKDITAMFAYRKVQYTFPHKFQKDKFFFKRQLDVNNSVLLLKYPGDRAVLAFAWEDDQIMVELRDHINPKPNQSVSYGYYDCKGATMEELTARFEQLARKKREQLILQNVVDDDNVEEPLATPDLDLVDAVEVEFTDYREELNPPKQAKPKPLQMIRETPPAPKQEAPEVEAAETDDEWPESIRAHLPPGYPPPSKSNGPQPQQVPLRKLRPDPVDVPTTERIMTMDEAIERATGEKFKPRHIVQAEQDYYPTSRQVQYPNKAWTPKKDQFDTPFGAEKGEERPSLGTTFSLSDRLNR